MDQFNFDYKNYRNELLTVKQIDQIANIILGSGTTIFGNIICGLKLTAIVVWLIAREKLIAAERAIAQQEYIIEQNRKDKDDVRDNFGGGL